MPSPPFPFHSLRVRKLDAQGFPMGDWQEVTILPPVCQVHGVRTDGLWCTHRDSHGYRCERTDEHTTGHYIGQHTIDHALTGNGYACTAVGA